MNVALLSPKAVLFEGRAESVIVPGEEGVFEILPFHKRIMSRLIYGTIFIEDKSYFIKRGIVMVDQDKVTIVAEERE
jgi:F0F1-type ATP synthase epsilon subunit